MENIIAMNVDPKLIRTGGRKAPVISVDELHKLLGAWVYRYDDTDDLVQGIHNVANNGLIEEEPRYKKFFKDLRETDFAFENFDAEDAIVLKNGVPVVPVAAGGDWQEPLRLYIYWDGSDIRAYVPRYGNTLALKEKRNIVDALEEESSVTCVVKTVSGIIETRKFNNFDEFMLVRDDEFDFADELCLEDVSSRIEAGPNVSIVKCLAKYNKARQKSLDTESDDDADASFGSPPAPVEQRPVIIASPLERNLATMPNFLYKLGVIDSPAITLWSILMQERANSIPEDKKNVMLEVKDHILKSFRERISGFGGYYPETEDELLAVAASAALIEILRT